LSKFKEYLKDFIALIYPEVCGVCDNVLHSHERYFCLDCIIKLPRTNYHQFPDNPIEKSFWGKFKIEKAAAFLFFQRGEKVQHLIHQLKYGGRKEIGYEIGKEYGKELLKSSVFSNVDVIVPIPLHRMKKKSRGYNQSEMFAKGLAEVMKIETDFDSVERVAYTETQTKKKRFARFSNVESIFKVVKPERLEGKHILLVDDVITTGATIGSCAAPLLEVKDVRVSIAGIAYRD